MGVLVTCGSYVLLVRQYRLLINDVSLEIPGGKVDKGETPEKSAIRECHEETGVECKNLKYLLNYYDLKISSLKQYFQVHPMLFHLPLHFQ